MKHPISTKRTLELDRIEDGEIVYYPYARHGWFLLKRLEATTDTWDGKPKICCEVLKCSVGPMEGHRTNVSPGAQVVPITEMEVLGLMAL